MNHNKARLKYNSLPISRHQKRFWLEWQGAPSDSAYNISTVYKFTGNLCEDILKRACEIFIEQHEICHARFSEDGQSCFYASFSIEDYYSVVDIDGYRADKEQIITLLNLPFLSLEKPLLRFYLLKGINRYYFIINIQHIISDAVCLEVIPQEISENYNALISGKKILAENNCSFTSCVQIENEKISSIREQEARNFWRDYIGDSALNVELPYIKQKKSQDRDGESIFFTIPHDQVAIIKKLAHEHKTTMFIVLASLYVLLLSKYCNQRELLINYPVNMRPEKYAKTTGCFVNNVPLKVVFDYSKKTLSELVNDIAQQRKRAKPHQWYSLIDIIQDQRRMRNELDQNYFNVGFVETNLNVIPLNMRGVVVENMQLPWSNQSIYHLCLQYDPRAENAITFKLEYQKNKISSSGARFFIDSFVQLIKDANGELNIQKYNVLNDNDYKKIVYDWNTTCHYPVDKTLHKLFEAVVERFPNNIALEFAGEQLTYEKLNKQANQLARYIRSICVQHNYVALYLERGTDMIASIIAVLKAGYAYVPIAQETPLSRIKYILKDTTSKILLTNIAYKEFLEPMPGVHIIAVDEINYSKENDNNLPSYNTAQDLAYVIYTSGTTGFPKGVMQPHANVARLFAATEEDFHFSERDIWTLYHSYAFDFSVWEIWGVLLYGGKLIIPTNIEVKDIPRFYQLCVEKNVSVLNQTPTAFYQFLRAVREDASDGLKKLRYVIFGGEALNVNYLRDWWAYSRDKGLSTELINMYGITETTVHVTLKRLKETDKDISNIGKPLKDLSAYVLDENLNPVSIGVMGELYVGGAGLARGYLNQPELTASRFIQNPFIDNPNERIYRSGDLVRYLPCGDMEYLGRNDSQVKIRGYRIELGEIEKVMSSLGIIQESVVLIISREVEGKKVEQLVAYYVAEHFVDSSYFIKELSDKLPKYMVPVFFIHLPKLPLTINGKIDKNALPLPSFDIRERVYCPPRNKIEIAMCEVWQQLLTIKNISVDEDFFRIGGDSILAVQAVLRLKQRGWSITVRDIYAHCTIEKIAKYAQKIKRFNISTYQPFSLVDEFNKKQIMEALSPSSEARQNMAQIEDIYPASYLQMGMLLESSRAKNNGTYHDVFAYKINAGFKFDIIVKIWRQLVDKHALLRTSFLPHQEYGFCCIQYGTIDLEDKIISLPCASVHETISKEKIIPFNPITPGLFKVYVMKESAQQFIVIFSFHHAITDGWSVASLIAEFARSYIEEVDVTREDLPFYGEFVAKEKLAIGNSRYKKFWLTYLSGMGYGSNYLIDRGNRKYQNEQYEISRQIDKSLATRALHCANYYSVSPDIVFMSAFSLLLAQFHRTYNVIFGAVVNNRLEVQGGDKLFGLHLNTIPMRVFIQSQTAAEIIEKVKQEKIKIYGYKQYPYGKMKEDLKCKKDIYQCAFNYIYFHVAEELLDSKVMTVIERFEQTNIPLTLHVIREGNTFTLVFKGLSKFIDSQLINKLMNRLLYYLIWIVCHEDKQSAELLFDEEFLLSDCIRTGADKLSKSEKKKDSEDIELKGYTAKSSEATQSLQRQVKEIWQKTLCRTDFDANDNFFDIGGNSINALTMHAMLKNKLGLDDTSVIDLFEYPTIRQYVDYIWSKIN